MKERITEKLTDAASWKDNISYYSTITSTNDVLKQMGNQGASHGTVLVAGEQTKGRGRLGRSFLSPPETGIYLSVLLRPLCSPAEIMHLTCAAAVSACDAIEEAIGIRPGIKWTNDIVHNGRKLAGILTELSFKDSNTVDYAVIGIGINCTQKNIDFPEDIRSFAGSLLDISEKPVDRTAIAAAMIDAFFRMNQCLLISKQEMLQQYKKDCITLGQHISIVQGDIVEHGKALDLDEDGGLIVVLENGIVRTVASGEVSVRGMYHYI